VIKAVWVPWKRVRKVCAPECDGLLLVDATLVPALGPELSTTAQGDELPAVDSNPELRTAWVGSQAGGLLGCFSMDADQKGVGFTSLECRFL
jgi:hypothetical protein